MIMRYFLSITSFKTTWKLLNTWCKIILNSVIFICLSLAFIELLFVITGQRHKASAENENQNPWLELKIQLEEVGFNVAVFTARTGEDCVDTDVVLDFAKTLNEPIPINNMISQLNHDL